MTEMISRYKHTYAMLKSYGHSPQKAYDILLEAARGDKFALAWIRLHFRMRNVKCDVQKGK